uniref:Protein dead ringer-like protein n=1 Tax=Acrobeloides nanus TaxID=290746 RepID=A0A914ENX9_9BILA
LYELSDDVKRKEWLDDWLGYMHRIGKPVTRIPIMAKQVLDLYELYRLVVQHGGLVEIINKKLWREITKGLNLPASITSAAFTLRTQYQKYLYDFECERENLSTPSELQQAIEGNKREGRRTGHGSGNGSSLNGGLGGSSSGLILSATGSGCGSAGTSANPFTFPFSTPHSAAAAAAAANSFLGKHLNGAFGLHDDQSNNGLSGLPTTPQAFAAAAFKAEQLAGLEAQQRHWEMLQRVAVEAATRQQNLSLPNMNSKSGRDSTSSYDDSEAGVPAKRPKIEQSNGPQTTNDSIAQQNLLSLEKIFKNSSTHIKLNNSCTPGGDNSMVVSMEVNGVMYQGVLFAVNQISITNGNGSVENSDVTDLSTKINGNICVPS